MTLAAHLASFPKSTDRWRLKIEEEMARPGADDTQISQWKREKLKLKDEMAKLQRRNGAIRH